MAQTIDFATGTRTKFTYDLANRLVSQKEYTGTGTNGEYLEFRPNPLGDSFFACFRNFKIAEFDSVSGIRLNRFISRL